MEEKSAERHFSIWKNWILLINNFLNFEIFFIKNKKLFQKIIEKKIKNQIILFLKYSLRLIYVV